MSLTLGSVRILSHSASSIPPSSSPRWCGRSGGGGAFLDARFSDFPLLGRAGDWKGEGETASAWARWDAADMGIGMAVRRRREKIDLDGGREASGGGDRVISEGIRDDPGKSEVEM